MRGHRRPRSRSRSVSSRPVSARTSSGPLLHRRMKSVVPAALDHQVGEAERERAVGAGAHAQPDIGLVGEPGVARIDHDQPHAALQRVDRRRSHASGGKAGVVAPQDQAAGLAMSGMAPPAARPPRCRRRRRSGWQTAAPAAQVECPDELGVPKAFIRRRMKRRSRRSRSWRATMAEGDGLRPVLLARCAASRRRFDRAPRPS